MEEENDKNDTIYSSEDDGNPTVMSEKVSNIASNIYNEFERMIAKYDQEVVSGLMPLIVSVLEQLDMAYTDNNEQLLELEVLSDDNEQLITQYEREKQLRKLAENKYLEIEDQVEVEKREAVKLSERLEHENKELDSRVRSYKDHINRQDERISDMKREYNTLHQRHLEIVHQYMERIERAEKKAVTNGGETPTTQKNLFRRRTNSSRSPGTTSASMQDLLNKGEGGMVSQLPKSPDADGPAPRYGSPDNKNNLSLTEEQLIHTVKDGKEGPKMVKAESSPPSQVPTHTAKLSAEEGAKDHFALSSSNTQLYSSSMSSISSEKSEEGIPRGSHSSTESSGPNLDAGTCSVTDINNIPIISMSEAEQIISPAPQSPNVSSNEQQWSTPLSKDAQAILASTPELDSSSSNNSVLRRTSGGQNTNQRPISLDLENLPEGVEADSLFAELSSQEPEVIGVVDTGADITTIGKELENVLKENSQLLATKSKLTTQKNDLLKRVEEISSEKDVLKAEMQALKDSKSRNQARVVDLEQELKRMRHDAEKATVALKEASVSAAHRKRFTRVEMARVLMERNQYKERLMELQEAVRWTEMIRASKERNLELQQKKKSSIWKFFSNLFGPTPKRPHPPTVSIRYGSPDDSAIGRQSSATPPNERRSNSLTSLNTTSTPPAGFGSENFDRQRLSERRERYKQVRAYLNSDLSEGRMQAYGWSLPAKYSSEGMDGSKDLISVPVPVYCRPLNLNDPGMKIWCAAGVNLTGGMTKDGGSAIGASVFYANSCRGDGEESKLMEATPSIVWIGSSTHSSSKVTIIDANYPQNVLDCFVVCTSHLLCIAAVPGAQMADYNGIASNGEERSGSAQDKNTEQEDAAGKTFSDPLGVQSSPSKVPSNRGGSAAGDAATVQDITSSDDLSGSLPVSDGMEKMSSVLPTMWLGAQSGCVYVHSAISQWRTCIQSIRLKDSILSIVHVRGRVLVALADGTVAIFHRTADGQWNFSNYHLLDLGRPHHSIRCMTVVHDKVWCGYRNKIQVIHPRTMRVEKTFDAHPRRESQVRQLAWIGDGVWVSIRLDSTLRLYNAHSYHHLQDIDIEPYVSKMLGTGKLGFSFVRITTLLLSTDRLWVGTGNGVILSIPLVAARPAKDDGEAVVATSSPGTGGPGGAVRVYSNTGKNGESVLMGGSFMPYCSMVNAQLSFHGHRDSVKFFVSVPGAMKRVSNPAKTGSVSQIPSNTSPEKNASNKLTLMLSGGEGYVDFRLGDGEEAYVEEQGDLISVTLKGQSTNERSHIMVWQVANV